MGGKTGEFIGSKAKESYAQKRSTFNSKLSAYNSRVKFGKSSTRENGLSAAEIGSRPKMEFSSGFMGVHERSLDSQARGLSRRDSLREEDQFQRNRLIGGITNTLG